MERRGTPCYSMQRRLGRSLKCLEQGIGRLRRNGGDILRSKLCCWCFLWIMVTKSSSCRRFRDCYGEIFGFVLIVVLDLLSLRNRWRYVFCLSEARRRRYLAHRIHLVWAMVVKDSVAREKHPSIVYSDGGTIGAGSSSRLSPRYSGNSSWA